MTNKKTILIKIGGELITNITAIEELFVALKAHSAINPIIVHGGGTQLDNWLEAINLPVEKINGMRVTCEKTVEVASAVFAGLVNKKLVAAAKKAGFTPLGLSLADANMVEANTKSGDPLGYVGYPVAGENKSALLKFLADDYLPIISSIGIDQHHHLVNVNADDAALVVSQLLSLDHAIFLTSVAGVLDNTGHVIPTIDANRFVELTQNSTIKGGMSVKVKAALNLSEAAGCVCCIGNLASLDAMLETNLQQPSFTHIQAN